MQINMFMVRVRFVSDAKGPLEDKPKRVVVTLARNHEEALQHARDRFVEMTRAGVIVEYGAPSQLPDTVDPEALATL